MVHKIDAADMAAFAFLKGVDSLSLGILLQSLISNPSGSKDELANPELAKLVKNILESTPKEGGKFTHLIHHLPTIVKLNPEIVKLIKPESESSLPLVSKIDYISNVREVPKEKGSDPTTIQKPSNLDLPKLSPHYPLRPEVVGSKSQNVALSQPMQHAIKEVVRALHTLLPNLGKKDGEKLGTEKIAIVTESLVRETAETTDTEFMESGQQLDQQTAKQENKSLPKSNFHPSFSPMNRAAQPVEKKRSFEPQAQTKVDKLKEPSMATQPQQPLLKKEGELERTLDSRPAPQSQPTIHSAEKNVIPGAPCPTQFAADHLRRKEKKKYPHYFSDREEGDEESKNNDPNQRQRK